MLNIVLFGPPGAGKGTQSQKIIDKYNLIHISTGEVLRKAIEAQTPLGIEAQKFIDDGNYVTDEMALEIIKEELSNHKNSNGFIFDGFPRTTFQAEQFSGILSKYGGDVNVMISLEVQENTLVKRLINRAKESGRPDDRKEGIIRKRIEIYNQRTASVEDYYKSFGKFESVNGIGEIDVIFDKICATIERYK
ncbi:MAG: adenylate kinase [Bacteroidales bacterium]|nr:adenylate kinase [Bacteroidales bacterium]